VIDLDMSVCCCGVEWSAIIATYGVNILRILRDEVFSQVIKSVPRGIVQRDFLGAFYTRGGR